MMCRTGRIAAVLLLLLLMSGCVDTPAAELPEPQQLYASVLEHAELPGMLALTEEELYDLIGIDPALYNGMAAYLALSGTAPDEILILHAVDDTAAQTIVSLLENRLSYKRESAERYLTENLPMLEKGIVRRDGLTVSLIVTSDMDGVLAVYETN